MPVRLAAQRKSLRKFNLPLLATTPPCESMQTYRDPLRGKQYWTRKAMILLEWRLVLGPNSCTPSSEYLREAEIFLQSQLTNKTVAQLSDSTFLQKSVCQL